MHIPFDFAHREQIDSKHILWIAAEAKVYALCLIIYRSRPPKHRRMGLQTEGTRQFHDLLIIKS